MAHAQSLIDPSSHPVIQDFKRRVHDMLKMGIVETQSWTQSWFVRQEIVQDYFLEEGKLEALLEAALGESDDPISPEQIRGKYDIGFAILIFVGRPDFIREFTRHGTLRDKNLPFTDRPRYFPSAGADDDAHGTLFDKFVTQQWHFCAHMFEAHEHHRKLDDGCILPIIEHEELGHGGSAVAYRIKLDPQYDELLPRRDAKRNPNHRFANTYVLKSYFTPDARSYYDSEVDAFRRLHPTGALGDSMIAYYGSFIYGDTYNVILEFADQGTLEDVFQKIEPPTSAEDIIKFYKGLFKPIEALVCLHTVKKGGANGPSIFQGWHQDVKPSNILVCSTEDGSEYDYQYKLADLGLSHFRKTQGMERVADKDTNGTRIYGAPECYRSDNFSENAPLEIKQTVDIWSYGCVLSEASVWVVNGKSRLAFYRRNRKSETSTIHEFQDGACFHDGTKMLDEVRATHIRVFEEARATDHVTKSVVRVMLNEMLDHRSDVRPTARQSRGKAENIIRDATKALEHQRASEIRRTESEHIRRPPPVLPTATTAHQSYPGLSQVPPDWERDVSTPEENKINANITDRTREMSPHSTYNEGSSQSMTPGTNRTPPTSPHPIVAAHRSLSQRATAGHEKGDIPVSPSEKLAGRSMRPPTGLGVNLGVHDRITNVINESGNALPISAVPESTAAQESLTMEYLSQYIENQENKFHPMHLPGVWRRNSLADRDAVFLIDNAASMRQHWPNVMRVFKSLAWLIGNLDPDGPELYFSINDISRRRRFKIPEALQEAMILLDRRMPGKNFIGTSDISTKLDEILRRYMEKLENLIDTRKKNPILSRFFAKERRPITVYILTDAVWETACDPKHVIISVVRRLQQLELRSTQVGIQFIQFGRNEVLSDRLEVLDSGLGLSPDIVDAEPADGNVWKMLLGSINKTLDGDLKLLPSALPRSH